MIFSVLSTASDPKVAFEIGNLTVQWYAVFIVTGMLLGLLYACWQAKKVGLTSDDVVELFLWLIPLAIVFARILYVLPRWNLYFGGSGTIGDKLLKAIAIWEGGITIIGGLVGGLLGAVFFTLRHKKQTNYLNVIDLVVVPVFIGQIIGRWGNFVNQEAFGLPITDPKLQFFPFGVLIEKQYCSGVDSDSPFYHIVYDHIDAGGGANWFCATFFYEGVWNTIGALICVAMWRKDYQKKYPGILMLFYLFWYCIGRFWLEFLRMDAVPVTKPACLAVALVALAIGIVYVIARNSQLAYRRVRGLVQTGAMSGAILTDYEVRNYKLVGKFFEKANANSEKAGDKISAFFNRLVVNCGYSRKEQKEYLPVDWDTLEYYHVPNDYKRKFNQFKKEDVYCAERNA